jgi:hypothetical protein
MTPLWNTIGEELVLGSFVSVFLCLQGHHKAVPYPFSFIGVTFVAFHSSCCFVLCIQDKPIVFLQATFTPTPILQSLPESIKSTLPSWIFSSHITATKPRTTTPTTKHTINKMCNSINSTTPSSSTLPANSRRPRPICKDCCCLLLWDCLNNRHWCSSCAIWFYPCPCCGGTMNYLCSSVNK